MLNSLSHQLGAFLEGGCGRMMEKTLWMSLLYDFYGQLLTDRQKEFFTRYYRDDLSLGEIAGQYGVSRQAVYDVLKRSASILEALEEKLELVLGFQQQRQMLAELDSDLAVVESALEMSSSCRSALHNVQRARNRIRDVAATPGRR